MKSVIRYILFFSILAAGGYSQLAAHTYSCTDSTFYSTVQHLIQAEHPGLPIVQHHHNSVIKSSRSGTLKANHKIDVVENEIEEDEVSSSKRHSDGRGVYVTSGFVYSVASVFDAVAKFSPLYNNNSYYTSSDRYIVFQVFRI
jgi:hypothetical protein